MLQKEGFPGALVIAEHNAGFIRDILQPDNLNPDATGDAQPGHDQFVAKGQAQLAIAEREKTNQSTQTGSSAALAQLNQCKRRLLLWPARVFSFADYKLRDIGNI